MKREYLISATFLVLFLVYMAGITFMGEKTVESPQNQIAVNTPAPQSLQPVPTIPPKPVFEGSNSTTVATPTIQAVTQVEYWIVGYVMTEEGNALPGSVITVYIDQKDNRSSQFKKEKKSATDEKGYYTIYLDKPGEGTIHSSPPEGYQSLSEEFSLTQSQPTLEKNFTHPPAPYYIQGKVVDAQTKSPIAGAEVSAMCLDNKTPPQWMEKSISKEDGSFKITRLTQGRYSLMASAEGYIKYLAYKFPDGGLFRIQVPESSQDHEYLIEMQPGNAATFHVVNALGQSVANAEITITGDDDEFDTIDTNTSDRDGLATNTSLPKRTLHAEAWHQTNGRGFSEAFTPGTPSQPVQVEITLQPFAFVSGKVLDSEGNTVPDKEVDAKLTAIPGWKFPPSIRAEPDEKGDYFLDTLAPGSYQLSLTRSHHYPVNPIQTQSLELKAGERRTGVDFIVNKEDMIEIKGKVIDQETSEPIEGISVFARPDSNRDDYSSSSHARTGADGEFHIERFIKKGEKILFHLSGNDQYLQTSHERPYGETYYTLTMKKGGQINGIVLDDKENPLAGVQVYPVRMYDSSPYHDTHRTVTTDDDGTFSFSKLDPMDYRFHAEIEGFLETDSETISVREGKEVETIIIRMEKGTGLYGTIVDPQGSPIPNAVISLLSNVPDISKNSYGHPVNKPAYKQDAISSESGQFQIENFPPQGDSLVVHHADFAPTLFVIDSSQTGQSPFTIRMTQGGGIQGITYKKDGKPEENAALYAQNYPDNQYIYETRSNENGEYRFEHLSPASYLVRYYGPDNDYESQQYKTVQVEEGQITQCDFGGGEGAVIHGTVYKRGQISPNAELALIMRGTGRNPLGCSFKTVSDERGAYSFPSLDAGEYTIAVTTESSETTRSDQPLHEGNCEFSTAVAVTGSRTDYTVDLYIASLEIRGVVLDEETNEPIGDAKIEPRIKVGDTNIQVIRNLETQTRSDGVFTLLPLESGIFNLVAIKDGYQAMEFEITVPPFNPEVTVQPETINVYMKKDEMAVYLRLFLEEKPAVCSWIHVFAEKEGYHSQILPSSQIEEGYYKAYGMPEGELQLRVSAYCFAKVYETIPQRITIRAGEKPQLMINLFEPENYGVILSTPDNRTLQGTALLELDGLSGPVSYYAQIRSNPNMDLYNIVSLSVPPGTANVRIIVPGYQVLVFNPASYPKPTINSSIDDLIRLPLIPQ